MFPQDNGLPSHFSLEMGRGAGRGGGPLPSWDFRGRCGSLRSDVEQCNVQSLCTDCLLALASYAWPDADDVAGRDVIRLEAVLEMRALARGCRHG